MQKLKTLLRVLSLVVVTGLVSSQVWPVFAQTPSPLPTATPELMTASSSGFNAITSPNGPHFFSGDMIVIDQDLSGDVYVAGGTVRVESRIDGDLLVGAGQVIINGQVTEDVRVGAGSVELNGQVGDDLTIGAGTVVLSQASQVQGSVVAGAGDVNLYGTIGENVWVGASKTTLGGRIGGDVNLHGDQANFLPGAVVTGSLSTRMANQPTIPESATISGQRQLQVRDHQDRDQAEKTLMTGAVMGVSLGWFIIWLLMGLVAGFIFLLVLPGMTRGLGQTVLQAPLAALGWGLVHLVLTPIAAVLLMMTIIGLPLGLILLLLWVMSLLVGGWIAALAVGQKLLGGAPTLGRSLLQLAVGLVILGLIGLVPVIGWLVKFVALLMGLGALVLWLKGNRPVSVLEPEVVTVTDEPVPVTKPVRVRRTKTVTARKVSKTKKRSRS